MFLIEVLKFWVSLTPSRVSLARSPSVVCRILSFPSWWFLCSLQPLCLVGRNLVPCILSRFVGAIRLDVMANIEDLWFQFLLTKEEEHGVDVPTKKRLLLSI